MTVLVMYIPALHASYIKFFEKYKDKVDALYILGSDLIADFPILEREIRAMQPEEVLCLLKSADYFKRVEIATRAMLPKLRNYQIVMSDETISDEIKKKYFKGSKVKQEKGFFLRFDEKYVKSKYGEADFSTIVSQEIFDRNIMKLAEKESEKSSDWWRKVGAVLVLQEPVVITHNKRMPSPHEPWAVGDPRQFITYGTDTHLKNVLHAEQGLIAQAARDGIKTQGASLYATTFPCPDCLNVVLEAGIKRIYFRTGYAELQSNDQLKAHGVEVIKVI